MRVVRAREGQNGMGKMHFIYWLLEGYRLHSEASIESNLRTPLPQPSLRYRKVILGKLSRNGSPSISFVEIKFPPTRAINTSADCMHLPAPTIYNNRPLSLYETKLLLEFFCRATTVLTGAACLLPSTLKLNVLPSGNLPPKTYVSQLVRPYV